MTARQQFRPIFNEPIVRAEVVDDDNGNPMLIVHADSEKFEIPVLQNSIRGFRTDLIGQRLVIGFALGGPTQA